MEPEVRQALLIVGIVFCLAFAAMTIAVVADSGLDILTVVSIGILLLIASGLIGAIRNPPDE